MKLTLRTATLQDAETILEINLRSILELCRTAYEIGLLQKWVGCRDVSYFEKNLSRGKIFLAELDGTPVGFFDVVTGEVLAVYVMPGYEWQGIGGYMLVEAIKKAQRGNQPVKVSASLNAVSFYERHGFRRVKAIACNRNGVDLPLVEMERAVGADIGL